MWPTCLRESVELPKLVNTLGCAAREWELSRGAGFDFMSGAMLRKIKKGVNARLVIAAMLAPLCSSFSAARDRAAVTRAESFPWELPDDQLSPSDQV